MNKKEEIDSFVIFMRLIQKMKYQKKRERKINLDQLFKN